MAFASHLWKHVGEDHTIACVQSWDLHWWLGKGVIRAMGNKLRSSPSTSQGMHMCVCMCFGSGEEGWRASLAATGSNRDISHLALPQTYDCK